MADGPAVSSAEGGYVRVLADVIGKQMVGAGQSATLDDVVSAGCWHLAISDKAREILFDMRALYLGFLIAGNTPRKGNAGNTAQWFFQWLQMRLGEKVLSEALAAALARSRLGQVESLLEGGYQLKLSISVNRLLKPASEIAQATVKRTRYEARHLFSAMIQAGAIATITQEVVGLTLSAGDLDDLKRTLIDHIMRSPQRGETRGNWQKALGVVSGTGLGGGSPPPPPPPPPDRSIAPFNGDTPSASGEDVLDTAQDVEALAQLVCLEGATPLAVAIFGDWGSGKSTFMARLEARVKALAGERAPAEPDAPGLARFVQPIVQIRFNAWHFADANLWASLTAEFFDQLRAGGYERSGDARHAELVEKVNLHVHALSDAVSANRQAVNQGAKDLLAAQAARDKAAKAAREAPAKALGQAAMDVLSQTLADQKGALARLGLNKEKAKPKVQDAVAQAEAPSAAPAEPKAGPGAEVVVEVVKDLASTFGKLKAIGRVLFKTPARAWTAAGLLLVLLAVGGVVLFGDWEAWRASDQWAVVAAALASLAGLVQALAPVIKLVNGVAERGAAIAAEVDKADKDSVSVLLTQEAKLKKALAEAKALEEAELASAKALSRYIDPAGASNPPRLLRYVLEDDPDTKALEKDIGLIGRTRRLFQAVDDIARNVREARRVKGYFDSQDADRETPERIVIYIDDLDRCSETKVYEVLQAIHLLLAFDLFVVVVGVDVNWVQTALARQFEVGEGETDPADEQKRRERAVAYLEKIFQVPFWLRPLGRGTDGTFDRFVRSLAGAPAEAAAPPSGKAKAGKARTGNTAKAPAAVAARASGQGAGQIVSTTGGGAASGTAVAPAAEVRRTLQLDKVEIDFLASPEIAAVAAAAPRGVKRLVNIYRLARIRRGQEDGLAILGGAGLPPEYPLIALMAAIETGQTHAVAEAFYDLLQSAQGETVHKLLAEVLNPPALQAPSSSPLKGAAKRLMEACEAAAKLRGKPIAASDLQAAARLVRRYSFNRFR